MDQREIEESLSRIQLPKFALFQNLVIGTPGSNPWPGEPLLACDWFRVSDDNHELKVPDPPLPQDPAKLIRILKRYDESLPDYLQAEAIPDMDQSDLDELRELAQKHAEFDTTINEFCEWQREVPQDKELFGVRYTLLFLCPHDPAIIVSYLMKLVKDKMTSKENNKLYSSALRSLWADCIDPMWICPEAEDASEIVQKVIGNLEKQLNELPNGPTKLDWDDLNESLMK